MLQFTGALGRFEFQEQRWNREVQRKLKKLAKEAAREWLYGVLNSIVNAPHTDGDSFPIQTGEAKGSFKPLARLLNQSRISVDLPISPNTGRPNRISQGAAQGYAAFTASAGEFHIMFEFSTDVEHFMINEYNFSPNVVSSTPWNSFAAGADAFVDYVENNVENFFPDINNYVVVVDNN